MSSPRAFIFEHVNNINVSAAEDFGSIVYLFEGPRTSIFNAVKLEVDLLRKLGDYCFDPKEDFIVASGDLLAVVTLVATVGAEYGYSRILGWDPRDQVYQLLEIGDYNNECSS